MSSRDPKEIVGIAVESLACFCLAAVLSIPAGGYDQSWWLSMLQLALCWRFVPHEGLFWLLPRSLYFLAVWMGFRSLMQWRANPPLPILAAGALSAIAACAAIGGALFLPPLSR